MPNHKLQHQQNESSHQSNSAKKATEVEKPSERLYENPFHFSVMGGATQPDTPFTPQNMLNLQRTIGNQAVGRMIQAKLKIGQPGDKYEQEADQIADTVLSIPDTQAQPQQDNKEEEIQTKPLAYSITPLVQRQVEENEEETIQPSLISSRSASLIQKQDNEEEEFVQSKHDLISTPMVQRQIDEEEETVQQTRLQKQTDEEEEMIQAQTGSNQSEKEEEAFVQKLSVIQRQNEKENEEPVQLKSILQKQEEELEKPLMQAGGDNTQHTSANIESRIAGTKNGGFPVPSATRSLMESRFGSDFSGVRVHTGSNAVQMSKELGAQAFTHGSDIYFNEGKYNPSISSGRRLLAHELTHVIQQNKISVPQTIFRSNGTGTTGTESVYEVSSGEYTGTTIDTRNKRLYINKISLPDFKGERNQSKFNRPLELSYRGTTNQEPNWRRAVSTRAQNHLSILAQQARERGGVNEQGSVFLQARERPEFVLFGNESNLLRYFEIPIWDRIKHGRTFQVDHIVERQIGGPDNEGNYELLDASANMSSGSKLAHQIRSRIRGALGALREEHSGNTNIPRPTRWQYVKNNYIAQGGGGGISFRDFEFNLRGFSGEPGQYWSLGDIHEGRHARLLRPMRRREMERLGQEGSLTFYASQAGGEQMPRPRREPIPNWIPRVDYLRFEPNDSGGESAGTLYVHVFKARSGRRRENNPTIDIPPDYAEQPWDIKKVVGIHGGVIDKESVGRGVRQSLRLPGMSPIELDTVNLGAQGISGEGRVLPTIPIIGDADIRIVINGNEVQLRKTFDIGEINVPSPFEINDASLTVFFGSSSGLGIEGQVDFGIEKLGEGFIGAAASMEGGFALEGQFNFDERLFGEGTNAEVRVGYRENQWSMGGTLTIPEGKVPGVRTATINVDYSEGQGFSAQGEAQLDVPGVESGTLSITHSEEEGFMIGGSFSLSSDTPGIRGGSIEVTVRKPAGEEQYKVAAQGTAEPDIPGLDTTLTIGYDDGIILIEGHASYSRGMLSGEIDVGVTNQAIDENGQPSGEPDEDLRAYGGGSLTLQLTPWLEATAGVRLTPEGEIEVRGQIGFPNVVEIFPRKSIDKTIFRMPTLEIPLFAIPLGPRSIGLVATISGGLTAEAGIGPGQITELNIGIIYNPDHEENTTITGTGRFVIPADAGLRLYARAGIGISIGIARVSGNIEVGAGLGLDGAAEANVDVNWSPANGLELKAEGAIYVQPKFKFDLSAVLEASLLFLSKEWRKTLAQFEYGPDLRFGIRFPIHYKEGEPFDISLDDVEFDTPEVDIPELVKGLGRKIID